MDTIQTVQLTKEEQKELEAFRAKKAVEAQKEKRKNDRKAYKELSEDFVKQNINLLVSHQEATEVIIEQMFKEYQTILNFKSEVFGTKIEKQGTHTSTLEDGSASITVGWNVVIGFDGTEAEGIKKIKEYMLTLVDDSDNVKILADMVNTFLKPNAKTGMLNPSKIIELNNLRKKINNPAFDEGMEIILNAQNRCRNSMFISGWKFVEREDLPPSKIEFRFTI